MHEHRIAGEQFITLPPGRSGSLLGVPVSVTVSPAGEVIDAAPEEGESWQTEDRSPALAAARQWRFRPFTYRGLPVAARGTIRIGYAAAAEWRDRNSSFPPVDPAGLRIARPRSSRGGSRPGTIERSGHVVRARAQPSRAGAATGS